MNAVQDEMVIVELPVRQYLSANFCCVTSLDREYRMSSRSHRIRRVRWILLLLIASCGGSGKGDSVGHVIDSGPWDVAGRGSDGSASAGNEAGEASTGESMDAVATVGIPEDAVHVAGPDDAPMGGSGDTSGVDNTSGAPAVVDAASASPDASEVDVVPTMVDAPAARLDGDDIDGMPSGMDAAGGSDGGGEVGGSSTGGATIGNDAGLETGGTTTDSGDAGGNAGYVPVSDFLLHPEHAIPVLTSLADFRTRARDDANGGFFSFTNVDGFVSADRRKGFVTQTRDAWAFSRAFMVSGDERYLDHAAHALNFLYTYGWDSTHDGWNFTADENGNLTPYTPGWDPNTWKWSFVQHYALLGIGANCEATRDAATCDWLKKGRGFIDTKMWDSNPARPGYYDQANLDMTNPQNKGFTPTADALTTNAIQVALLWPTAEYNQRMVDLANIVATVLAANMDLATVKLGFPENYTTDWVVDTSRTTGDVGHVLKSAWVLARVYLRHPDARYRQAARKLIYNVLEKGGWDESSGVPYTGYDWSTGNTTKQAECWQIEQAITSGLSNWYIADNQTDRDMFLRMADRSLQFFYRYVVDHTNGGTYKMNSITGEPTDFIKGNFYNVEYHSTETFYFTYLYGSLMLRRVPVALYYKVAASTNQRVIQLNPLAIDDASLQIQSVTLNGQPLTTFAGPTREVTLAAGQGGKLRVVFSPTP